jgi:hypothetical protein
VDVPCGNVGAGAGAGIFMFHIDRPTGGRWKREMFAPPGLDAGFFIGAQHVIARSQGLALPTTMIKVQDAAGLDGESRVAREYPATMPPRSQRVLAEPTPQGGAADPSHQALVHGFAAQFAERPVRQWQSAARGQFTGQRFDFHHDTGGKSAPVARRAVVLRARPSVEGGNVDATC